MHGGSISWYVLCTLASIIHSWYAPSNRAYFIGEYVKSFVFATGSDKAATDTFSGNK